MSSELISVLNALDKKYIDEHINEMLYALGSNIKFEENTWLCDNAENDVERDCSIKLYFSKCPDEFIDYVKYYALIAELRLSTKIGYVGKVIEFMKYLKNEEKIIRLDVVNQTCIKRYKMYLDRTKLSHATKVSRINCLNHFFLTLSEWEGLPKNNPINIRQSRYKRNKGDNQLKTRYIPETITLKLDEIFKSDEVPLCFRLYYWICRMYPSRCKEISKLRVDSIKKVSDDEYVLFKKVDKPRNDLGETELVDIYIKYKGLGKYMIDLFYEQKSIAEKLQYKSNKEKYKGLLFLYHPVLERGNKEIIQYNRVCLLVGGIFNRYLKRLSQKHNISVDENISVTTHSFRHNNVTDKLDYGYKPIEVRDSGGWMDDVTIYDSYYHSNTDKSKKTQAKNLKERYYREYTGDYTRLDTKSNTSINNLTLNESNIASKKVVFRGRIMNLDEKKEKWILSNKRAYSISSDNRCIGICTDIYSCKEEIFACLGCDEFAPDSNEVDYYREQAIYWEEQAEHFEINGKEFQAEYASQTRDLFKKIVSRIESLI
ncbi:phage integrase SAM-like domain-containing protein [Romboutsia sp. 1001713B170207_170306_H8]|uniref:phage integrase SAM-like domain-containing protein n=1 Tax=Romboutsia sp. 1001713B170207_170306_H8 TaxID=2787112 RepID=UPI00189B5274|nr:phage integrase SAM-like domain-containing protein [Romboutsia sp. 1001713B170207_170306_H8]